jgi:2,4-dienoyl-CoA reductase-like NADH-dependent reductase (Old Yellow Enzyme family)
MQLAHAGRKGGTQRPWDGHGPLGEADAAKGEPPWTPIGPSPIPASPGRQSPAEITAADIAALKEAWRTATLRTAEAGYEAVEIHGAHGYLLHTFLSPHSNRRTDGYGGDMQGRMRFPLEIAEIVRAAWPAEYPLFYRVSAVDEGGWTIEETVTFARELKARGVDVIDCSSGSLHDSSTANVRLKRGFGFQVPFAEQVKRDAGIATMAVGLITDPHQAESILREGKADIIAIGRESLFNPTWPLHAEQVLGGDRTFASWPKQHGWWLDKRATIIENIRRDAS